MYTFINSLKELSKLRNSASESEPFLTSTKAAFDFTRVSRPLSSLLNAGSDFSPRLMKLLYGILITFFLDNDELASKFFEELKLTSLEQIRLRTLDE
jgi:hypothetical protein